MHRPFAQQPRGRTLSRISHICDSVTTPRLLSLCQQGAKSPCSTLSHRIRRVKHVQKIPNAGLILQPAMLVSRSYRWATPKPMTRSPSEEAHTGSSKANAAPRPQQLPLVDAKDAVVVVQNARDMILSDNEIPSELDVLAVLLKCNKSANFLHDVFAEHFSGTTVKSATAASSLLSLDGSEAELTQSTATKVSEAINALSEIAFSVVSHPTVLITPQVLNTYIETQARIGRVETLPHVLNLYASKPKPQGSPGALNYVKQNPDKAANAVDSGIVEKALDATIEAKNLDAAIGVIENTYATKAFVRAKLLKKALLPTSAAVATPFAVYILASKLSHFQDSFDQKTATAVATAGILTYVGFTGWIGVLSALTQNDHMERVTWAPGMPLRERWVREEERAALDKVACTFGFSQTHRFGEEEGAEFQALREFILRKGMVLDRVELMQGMS